MPSPHPARLARAGWPAGGPADRGWCRAPGRREGDPIGSCPAILARGARCADHGGTIVVGAPPSAPPPVPPPGPPPVLPPVVPPSVPSVPPVVPSVDPSVPPVSVDPQVPPPVVPSVDTSFEPPVVVASSSPLASLPLSSHA